MSLPVTLNDFLKSLTSLTAGATVLGTDAQGQMHKVSWPRIAEMAFGSGDPSMDLDNPTARGVFNVNANTQITRPTKGTGWNFGYVFNIASATGIQVWFNFSGYIAVRGKGSASDPWSEWSVMAKM